MRNIVIAVVIAAAAFFGWKKYQSSQTPEPAAAADPNKTPGANAANRVEHLSGAAPVE
jgi:predicted negative regulator of RcsB-dependent stress response